MLTLCIDIGNSRTKTGVFLNDKLVSKGAYTDLSPSFISDIFNTYPDIKFVMISSVAGERPELVELIRSKCNVVKLSDKTRLPLKLDYRGRPGNDRIAASVAATYINPEKPTLIVDCGTCITYSLVNANTFLGGAISPGIHLRFKALNEYTANLPLLNYDNDLHPVTGRSTNDSIYSGVLNGSLSEVDGMIDSYKKLYPDLQVIITGGMCGFFENGLKNVIFADADLVLKGLHYILRFNAPEAYS